MNPRERPLLAFDKDCGFCRRFIHRWRRVVGDKVEFRPSAEVADQFPAGVDFAQSVALVEEDGTVSRGAEAVFRMLARGGREHALPLWLYRNAPGFRQLSEALYRAVARNRMLASRLTKRLLPDPESTPSTNLTRSIFLRALGLVFLCAFGSIAVQADGLIGSKGITPAPMLFGYAHEQLHFSDLPSLLWFNSSDGAIHALCIFGGLLSVALIAGIAPRLTLILLWALYLSVINAGDVFLQFQWDLLLVETAVLAVFFAPWTLLLRRSQPAPENRGGLFLLRLLLFRLMFSSGVVKLASHDPAWRDFTALRFHYWTQPLPGPLSAFAHFMPDGVLTFQAVTMFIVELVVPFFIFAPRKLRLLSFVPLVGLQLLILSTGNYGFFNVLTIVLCITLLDDAILLRLFPKWLRPHAPWRPSAAWRTGVSFVLVTFFVLLGLTEFFARFGLRPLAPKPLVAVLEDVRGFNSINSYGLFAVMTKTRPEIILEGSSDGTTWKPYEFRYKPGALDRVPPFLPAHMPRLDWMMWFASLGSCRDNPWFVRLQDELLRANTDAVNLFQTNPFPDAPPKFLHAQTWQYRFSTPEEKKQGAPFWSRTFEGPYCPTLTLKNGELKAAAQ